ncbi:outer membrane protein assembly factor BamB family protein [Chengkuizengella axinellae]|uniref:PQQ-binding-like beta-propeller repeat protein n=1 Tax=Chengkuizengella axinellae TaxID=3064388 RepID=A0ABT9ITR6_9BACL|nr:PQQ-binding-like beta-propeller repeat protein [Chengkuizengella sp. 2205SS18-9]MDP5272712.1 PQQ-binding-like beta-propeller repeat protein [Chengkuizengella sp. 2205SS18-9]
MKTKKRLIFLIAVWSCFLFIIGCKSDVEKTGANSEDEQKIQDEGLEIPIDSRFVVSETAKANTTLSGDSTAKDPLSAFKFHGDLNNNAVYNSPSIRAPKDVKWEFQSNDLIVSSPAVVNGRAFFGSYDRHFYAVDIKDGSEVWKFQANSAISSSPAVSEKLVYFSDVSGNIYALDVETGQQKWLYETMELFPAEIEQYDYFTSSPTIMEDTVYIGGGDSSLYAIDKKTGELKWKKKSDKENAVIRTTPAIVEDVLFYADSVNNSGFVRAVDRNTGEELWNFNVYGLVQSSPVVVDGTVYIGTRDPRIYAINANTGEYKWSFTFGGSWNLSTATVVEDTVYIGSSDSHRVYILDAETGDEKWVLPTGDIHAIHSSPIYADGVLYFGTGANYEDDIGTLRAIDVNTHEELWRFQTEDKIISSPVIQNGVIYVTSFDGKLYAIE